MSLLFRPYADEFEELVHFAPTADQRKVFAKTGVGMPDGSFFIRNSGDLDNAIRAVGRATPNANETETARRNAVRRHIMKRAKALNLESKIPDTWNADGSLKHAGMTEELVGEVEDFLKHFGRKGMRWGVHMFGRDRGTTLSRHPVHPDAISAKTSLATVRKHGTSALSNKDLAALNQRLNLETQFKSLNQKQVEAGRSQVSKMLTDVGSQTAKSLASQFAAQGAKYVAKKLSQKIAK